jgi:hypothetical protein
VSSVLLDPAVRQFPILSDVAALLAEHEAAKKIEDAKQLLADLHARFNPPAAPKA